MQKICYITRRAGVGRMFCKALFNKNLFFILRKHFRIHQTTHDPPCHWFRDIFLMDKQIGHGWAKKHWGEEEEIVTSRQFPPWFCLWETGRECRKSHHQTAVVGCSCIATILPTQSLRFHSYGSSGSWILNPFFKIAHLRYFD